MSTRWFRSLRTEGTALLLGFVLLVEIVYAWAALTALHETTARVAAERLEEARTLAQRFDGVLALGRERLQAVAEQPGLALWLASGAAGTLPRGAAIPQRETLHYLFFRSEIFSGPVAVVDRRARLLFTEPYDAERIDARLTVDHPAVLKALADRRPQVSGVPLPWRQGPSAVLVEPIVDLAGQTVGALLGEIALGTSKLAGFLDDPRYGSGSVAALLDEQGAPLLAGARAAALLTPEARPSLPLAGQTGALGGGGARWLVARAQLRGEPWSVLVAEDDREAFAPLRALELRLLLTGLLIGVVAVAFSLMVLGRIVRPLEVLTVAASGVPLGDFSRPLPRGAPGELDALSSAFAGMRRDLEATLRGLRESEERYRRSIDSANDVIFAVDPVGLEVIRANRKACEVTGLAAGELITRLFVDLYPAEHQEKARGFLAKVNAEGEGSLADIDLVARGGGRLPVSISASLIIFGGGRFLQLICRDLSERKKMEQELVQAEKLSTIGVLATGLLHELNTPLSFLFSSLEEAQVTIAQLPAGKQADMLKAEVDDAIEGARRANTIVRDLRIFSRANQGQAGSFDLNDAVRMALRMAQHELKYKATVRCELGQLPQVSGHATEVSQVFLNLLVNAGHAIAPGNPKGNEVRIVTSAEGNRAIARITDTGAGIAPEVVLRIFEPFFTTKPEGVGTGLGLSICRDIVTRVGGEIRVESKLGVGTTFTVALPLAPLAAS